ncbi:MAG: hypothetical protein ACI39U_01910 [Candidatus Cryptobacteroides sp.]
MKRFRIILMLSLFPVLFSCGDSTGEEITILSWAGIPLQASEEAFAALKECGIDGHLGLYPGLGQAGQALDAAQAAGIWLIPGFPGIRDSTEIAVGRLKDHPALRAWHLKDEPETWDFQWLGELAREVDSLDKEHPCYINLYPNWAWGVENYAQTIDRFAEEVDVPFYSFDQYPITGNEDGSVSIRPDWYRNLEEFSAMARERGKPFWAFALTKSHRLEPPSPEAFYPVPTAGHLRLQVFSNLLYGAQGIQYFTGGGIFDCGRMEKNGIFPMVKEVNAEIKAYSKVFAGAKVLSVVHTGRNIPDGTNAMETLPHECLERLEVSGEGAVISQLRNGRHLYLAIQNRDCCNPVLLDIRFNKKVKTLTPDGETDFDNKTIRIEDGDIRVFRLR